MAFHLTDDDRTLILQAEIAVLMHDIGKFTKEFVESKTTPGGSFFDHSADFLDSANPSCNDDLRNLLSKNLEKSNWLNRTSQNIKTISLGDIIKHHHGKKMDHLGWKKGDPAPLLLALAMIADSIDSASSKGGADFKSGNGRTPRLNPEPFKQDLSSCYLSSPFGEQECQIDLDAIDDKRKTFQQALYKLLSGYETWNYCDLKNKRNEMLQLMRDHLSSALAETRLPANDVTLWQHSHATACIFKAMLVRHLVLGDYRADENGYPAHHKEKLSFIGVRWNEDELLARVLRPRDILGRQLRISKLMKEIKNSFETKHCIGNEVYRDRNGICFLVPDPDEDKLINESLDCLLKDIERHLNSNDFFSGDLKYNIYKKSIGIQILGFTDVLEGNAEILRTGPREPGWIDEWRKFQGKKEICTRCGLRPVSLVGSSVGAERDKDKICAFCKKLIEEAGVSRHTESEECPGLGHGAKYFTFQTDQLVPADSQNRRLALIQGVFDLRPFLSGEAFASILCRKPEDYDQPQGENDHSLCINSWDKLFSQAESCWQKTQQNGFSDAELHTFQQIFHDTFLGERDGRAQGKNDQEKLENYIRKIVLKSTYPLGFNDKQKIALYALRQHPAPSRIARAWEITDQICRSAAQLCEKKEFTYFPVSRDPGRFMILTSAVHAWNLLQEIYGLYIQLAGRVRHLLPFHLSASVFGQKFPLYIGIDAMRRFKELALSRPEPEVWTLKEKIKNGNTWALFWEDHKNRPVTWYMPALTPNNRDERFFTWFWKKDGNRPFCIDEIKKMDSVFIRPSTFDYEVMDTTTRRYDINEKMVSGRPHLFCGRNGPRPYPLEHLGHWSQSGALDKLKALEKHQLSRLVAHIGDLHINWQGYPEEQKAMAKDCLKICAGKHYDANLLDLAVSGALFDIIEWHHFIGK